MFCMFYIWLLCCDICVALLLFCFCFVVLGCFICWVVEPFVLLVVVNIL